MLIIAQTIEILNCHASTTLHVLENLGLGINYHKSVLIPAAILRLSHRPPVYDPGFAKGQSQTGKERICQSVLNHPQVMGEKAGKTVRALDLYHLSCLSRSPRLQPPAGSQKQSPCSSGYVQLSPQALEKLWFRGNLDACNGKSLISSSPNLITETDAAHYITRMGRTKSPVLARLAKDLWEWCSQHMTTPT